MRLVSRAAEAGPTRRLRDRALRRLRGANDLAGADRCRARVRVRVLVPAAGRDASGASGIARSAPSAAGSQVASTGSRPPGRSSTLDPATARCSTRSPQSGGMPSGSSATRSGPMSARLSSRTSKAPSPRSCSGTRSSTCVKPVRSWRGRCGFSRRAASSSSRCRTRRAFRHVRSASAGSPSICLATWCTFRRRRCSRACGSWDSSPPGSATCAEGRSSSAGSTASSAVCPPTRTSTTPSASPGRGVRRSRRRRGPSPCRRRLWPYRWPL